jgi:hypothetical protein
LHQGGQAQRSAGPEAHGAQLLRLGEAVELSEAELAGADWPVADCAVAAWTLALEALVAPLRLAVAEALASTEALALAEPLPGLWLLALADAACD